MYLQTFRNEESNTFNVYISKRCGHPSFWTGVYTEFVNGICSSQSDRDPDPPTCDQWRRASTRTGDRSNGFSSATVVENVQNLMRATFFKVVEEQARRHVCAQVLRVGTLLHIATHELACQFIRSMHESESTKNWATLHALSINLF